MKVFGAAHPGAARPGLLLGFGGLMLAAAFFMLSQEISPSDPQVQSQLNPPLTHKLLLVDVDGLRADFARDPAVMPVLNELAARGAAGIAATSAITLSLPAIKAWTTGAGFSVRDMVANFWRIDPGADSIFRQANLKGRSIAYAGSPEWDKSFHSFFQASFVHDAANPDTAFNDRQTQIHARQYAEENKYDILVVHYVHADMTAHLQGAIDGQYANALHQIDEYIGELTTRMGEDATILILSDHGMTDEGFHSTPTPDVVNAPFVLAGKGVKPASDFRLQDVHLKNVDIAPTVAALLGVGFPSQSEGDIASSLLDATEEQKARWEAGYAASRLNALHRLHLEASVPAADLDAAEANLRDGRWTEASSLAQHARAISNAALVRVAAQRSGMIMAAGVALGWGGCFLAIWTFTRGRPSGARRHVIVSGLLCCGVLGLVWFLAVALQDHVQGLIVPFRLAVLRNHWTVVSAILGVAALAIALATPKLRISSPGERWWPALFTLAAGVLSSFNQVHDLIHWAAALTLGVFVWRIVLFDRKHFLDIALYAALFVSSIGARRLNTLTVWYASHLGSWVNLLALLALFVTFVALTYLIYHRDGFAQTKVPPPFRPGAIPSPAWFLLMLGVVTQMARYQGWKSVDLGLLASVLAGLAWAMRSSGRTPQSVLLSGFLAILAAFPLVYPAYYLPVIALAMIVCCLSAKRLAARSDPSSMAAFAVAGLLFLFFAFSGDMNLVVIDVKRNQLLDPEFAFAYSSILRIAVLLMLQLVLPILPVLLWIAQELRQKRAEWLRTNALLHLFFLAQLVSLIAYLQLKMHGINSLFEQLSQLILVFALYLAFFIAAWVGDRVVWSAALLPSAANPEPALRDLPAMDGLAREEV